MGVTGLRIGHKVGGEVVAPWRPVRVARIGQTTVHNRVPSANILNKEKRKAVDILLQDSYKGRVS